jgi:hypothetical protein
MADKLTSSDLDSMKKSLDLMTDLSKNLRSEFIKIKNTTDVLSQDFKDIVKSATDNKNIAERYLITQKVIAVYSEKINELKSKSGYLDKVSLQFKKNEVLLQNQIVKQNINLLTDQINKGKIDAAEGLKRIESLKMQRIERLGELNVLERLNGKNNKTLDNLYKQRESSEEIINNIELISENESIRNKLLGIGKKILGDMGTLGSAITKSFDVEKLNKWKVALELVTLILEKGYENFKSFDKTAVSVRSNLGVLPGQANKLESLIKEVGIDSMHLGATFEDIGKSITAIAGEFNSLVAQDKELLKTTTALAKQFGIAEGTSVKFLKTLGGISGSSTSSQRSMAGFAQKIAQAAGVPLGKIMEDIANASDDVRIYVGSSAVSMIKAAAAARMMGIDLNKAASSAEKLLQFETSINAELKASALLGQNINFNYARQLSFNKNIIGANQEILKIAKQVNFNQLNPIQQKAFADAAGKSVGELQDMLTQEKNIQLVRDGTNEKAKKALADYERLMQLKEEEAKNIGKVAEQEILRKANQEKLAQIQNKFNQLMSELSEPVMEITGYLLDIAIGIMPLVTNVVKSGIFMFKGLSVIVGFVSTKLGEWITKISAFVGPLSRSSKILLSIGKFILPIITAFGKWLTPIGWVITAFMGLKSLMDGFKKYWDESADWPSKMWTGLKLLAKAIIEAFLPFEDVRKYLDKWFFGKSPSMAGKLIMKGFSSIGPELHDSLTRPMESAYKDIEDMSPPGINVENTTTNKLVEKSDNELISAINTSNQQLIAKMDQLINLMANGGIAVNMDGQRVQNALSRVNYRSGGFGQSTTLA